MERRELLRLAAGSLIVGGLGLGADSAEAATVVVNGHRINQQMYRLWYPNRRLVGVPTTNEYAIPGGTKQKFTKALMYTSAAGPAILIGHVRATFADAGGVATLGIPIGIRTSDQAATLYQRSTKGAVWWSAAAGGQAVPSAKTVRLAGVSNFRDAAGEGDGLAVKGGRMRRRVLYRSNRLRDLTATDASVLHDLGVTRIIDLRTPAVIASAPDQAVPGATRQVIDIFGATKTSGANDLYRSFVYSPTRRNGLRRSIAAIAGASAPTLVHCTHGKDRTGWVVGMIQLALGASVADVLDEWLLSNSRLGITSLSPVSFRAGLTEAERRYGSVRAYRTLGLGITPEVLARLRARLVV